jgi:lysophospholipase L1-like esterase
MYSRIFGFFLVLSCLANGRTAMAQDNLSFESGLTGWTRLGKPKNIRADTTHPYKGSFCVRIGTSNGGIMKRVDAGPLSIVQFNAWFRSDRPGVKGNSFMQFYNADHHLLLEYKSPILSSADWQTTGNYTETPAGTAYMTIGIEKASSEKTSAGKNSPAGTSPAQASKAKDSGNSKSYLYADEFTVDINIGVSRTPHQPTCDLDQYLRPFWQSDTIFNETILLYSADGQAASGRLLYQPDEILSVRSFDGRITYTKGVDYDQQRNTITRRANSRMPFRTDTSFDRKKDFAWYDLQSQWVIVTYTHKDPWTGPVPGYKGDRLPHTLAKLRTRSPLKIAAFGMSITRGLNVSSYDSTPPYMPPYVDLFTYRLKKIYGYEDIEMYNAGLPGSVSDWGAQYADKYINPLHPDLVILDFGMNDFWKYDPEQFKGFIQTMMEKIRAGNPEVEFLLLSNLLFAPDYILDTNDKKGFYTGNMLGYNKVLQQMEGAGVADLDMTTLSDTLYHRKAPKDCLANPLHPNDYMARWYAQGMAAIFIR